MVFWPVAGFSLLWCDVFFYFLGIFWSENFCEPAVAAVARPHSNRFPPDNLVRWFPKNFFFGSSVGLFLDHWELVFYLNMVGEDLRNNLFAILSYRFLNCWFFGPSPGSLSSDVTFSFTFWEYFDRKTFVCLLWPQSLVPIPIAFLQTIWCANFQKLFLRLFSRTLSGPLRIGFYLNMVGEDLRNKNCLRSYLIASWTVGFLARRRVLSPLMWRFLLLSGNILIGKLLCACCGRIRSSIFQSRYSRQSGALISKNFFFGSSVRLLLESWVGSIAS